jgi:prepilin-type N-terminal cleavage/methylation domain-containing protein
MNKRGFTIVEVLVVLAIMAILMMIAIPSFSGVQSEARQTKIQKDLQLLKIAIESYHRTFNKYPDEKNYQATLLTTLPKVIEDNMLDPFGVDTATPYKYYLSTSDPETAKCYVVYSVGINGDGKAVVDNHGRLTITNGPIFVSNGYI